MVVLHTVKDKTSGDDIPILVAKYLERMDSIKVTHSVKKDVKNSFNLTANAFNTLVDILHKNLKVDLDDRVTLLEKE